MPLAPATTAAVEAADVVLLDVGGVLFVDPWEHLLLAPGTGVAAQLELDVASTEAAGRALWPRFATSERTEAEWWEELEHELGVRVPELVRDRAHEGLGPTPLAADLLELAAGRARLGVITDNTTFWYALQARVLGLRTLLDPDLVFVSCVAGCRKKDRPGLLDVAAATATPADTLVVDDRRGNIERAAELGFRTLQLDGTAG